MCKHRELLVAALGFVQVRPETPALRMLHDWLDSWSGVRWIAEGMHAEQHALSLKRGPPG